MHFDVVLARWFKPGSNMNQNHDRWVLKILTLPVFSNEFAVLASPFSNLALVASMEVKSGFEFVAKVHEWSGAFDESVRTGLLKDTSMLEQFWALASSVEKAFFESTAHQLGFGLCDPVTAAISAETARARRAQAIKALVEKPLAQPRKAQKTSSADQSATPLLDMENAEKVKWSSRLSAIGQRAGSYSKLFQNLSNTEGLSSAETDRLRQLVLSAGAPRTMAAHISTWERFEEWVVAGGWKVFPVSIEIILKYALFLDSRECGPTVVPSLRTAIKWVTSRLAIDCPDLSAPPLIALQNDIVQKRAKTLKEAIPFPIEAVACLEELVVDLEEPNATRLTVWWWLCMIFASLRFDDAIHVKPQELIMTDEGLFGVAWQTKVERKRRGTKFVVPHVGFRNSGWLEMGWMILQDEDPDRDFWIPELNTRHKFGDIPPTYQRSLQWLKFLTKLAVNRHYTGSEDVIKGIIGKIPKLTAHSARVTLLDAAVHAGRGTEEIGLQANWKNAGPLVLKYTRNRTSVPAQMIQQLVKDMNHQAHPFEARADEELEEDESAPGEVMFYIKQNWSSRASYDYRYHCSSADDAGEIACGRVSLEDCSAVGALFPDVDALCKHCARARPDVASRCIPLDPADL